MPRRKLIRQNIFPYHVVTRTNNKDWFRIPLCDVWDICKESLHYSQAKRPAVINCFVLMSNHYHLLITTPNEDIDEFMQFFNLRLSRLISIKSGAINQKFSNRYKWSIVDKENYLMNVYRYIYQNPVRAKITLTCDSYPYSSLKFSRIEAKLFNYKPHLNYATDKAWIEEKFSGEFNKIIHDGLQREIFKPHQKISKFHNNILSNNPVSH